MGGVLDLPAAGSLADRRTTPDHVAEVLREAILTGRLNDGVELNQVAIAEHFQISRVPVREALRQLKAEGLVRHEAHRRAVVQTLTPQRVEELFDLRVMLEAYMLERAIPNLSAGDLDRLDELARSMRDLDVHDEWLRANREFHRILYEPSRCAFTAELAGHIAARTTRYLFLHSGGEGIAAHEEAQREHEEILAAARARDVAWACRALAKHIEGTRARVREFFAGRAQGDTAADEPGPARSG